jgi:predicted CoA-binding protein
MTKMSTVNEFLSQKSLAIVGVSQTGKKFSNYVFNELKSKGYQVIPVNPNTKSISGETCYPNLKALHEKVGGVVVITKPTETEKIVREAQALGIKHVWIQQDAESEDAIRFCKENGMNLVHGECILMFAEPAAFFHRAHRWVWGVFGKLPK